MSSIVKGERSSGGRAAISAGRLKTRQSIACSQGGATLTLEQRFVIDCSWQPWLANVWP